MKIVRALAYAPLRALETFPLFLRRGRALARTPSTGYSLFTRTQGFHGGTVETAMKFVRRNKRRTVDERILVLGCGPGEEVGLLAREASMVIGQDLLDLSSSWRSPIPGTAFVRSNAALLPFSNEAFDIVFAKAVFEHLQDFEDCAREVHRVLRPQGLVWADFGPLWHSHGGIHDSRFGYDHLLLDPDEIGSRLAPGSAAELFWNEGMFSRLRPREYRSILEARFEILQWRIGLSAAGWRYKKHHSEVWKRLRNCWEEEDLLVGAIYFLGRKRGSDTASSGS